MNAAEIKALIESGKARAKELNANLQQLLAGKVG